MAAFIWRDGRILHANQLFLDLFNCERPQVALNQPLATFVSDETLALARQTGGDCPLPSNARELETTGRRSDGSLFPLQLAISRLDVGENQAFFGLCTDLSERRLAEESLRRVQFSVDHAADLVYWADSEGRVVDASASTTRRLGFSREELLGMTLFELTVGLTPEAWPRIWDMTKSGSYGVERELRTKEGKTFPASIAVKRVIHEGREYNCIFAHDLSERRLADAEIRHLSSFPESNPYPVLEFDGEGHVLYANRAAEAEASRLGLTDLHEFLPLDKDELLAVMSQPSESHFSREISIGGEVFEETISFLPDFDSVRVFAADVTERKQVEEQLRLTQLSVDNAADLIHWSDIDGRLLYVSDSSCRRHGYSREELLAMTIFDLDPNETRKTWKKRWQELKTRSSLTFESVHQTKEGELFPIEVVVNYVKHNGKEYNFAFGRDITERKKMEESLSLTQFSVDRSADCVFWTSPARSTP